jgi:uncharacterized membrane protein/HAMP domain-containing protein
VVYALLNSASNVLLMPAATFISLRPQVTVPMTVGVVCGPLAGFVTGALGNLVGDAFSGYGMMTFWNWHLANGLMGLIPGLVRVLGIDRVSSLRAFAGLQLAIVLSCVLAVGTAVGLDALFVHTMRFPGSWESWIFPALVTNAANGFALTPLVLLALRRITVTLEVRTTLMITYLMVVTILTTAGAITWSVWGLLVSREAMIHTFYFAGALAVTLLVSGFGVAVFFVRRFTGPIQGLTRAAEAVQRGEYELESLAPLALRDDEFGQLSRVFERMAAQVRGREQQLRQRVEELEIRVDRKQQARDVSDIVESDYFQDLQRRVRELRDPS